MPREVDGACATAQTESPDRLSLVNDVLQNEGASGAALFLGSTLFLNGDLLEEEQWARVVAAIYDAAGNSASVVVFAQLEARDDYQQVHRLRRAVVDAGGILYEMEGASFGETARAWASGAESAAESAAAKRPAKPEQPPAGAEPDWSVFRDTFLDDESFDRLRDELTSGRPASKSVIS